VRERSVADETLREWGSVVRLQVGEEGHIIVMKMQSPVKNGENITKI
jgi:hypothetical protein